MTTDESLRLPCSRVGVFAAANGITGERHLLGVKNLRLYGGVEVEMALCGNGPRHFGGSDEFRAGQLNRMVRDGAIDGMIALRGGYGALRIAEMVDYDDLRDSGKFLCGYSDISGLLLAAWKHGCRRLFHGPMVASGWEQEGTSEAFRLEVGSFVALLKGKKELRPSFAYGDGITVLRPGRCVGAMVPVNFSILQSMMGTAFLPELSGTVLCLEDVNIPAHDLDRKLNQLRQCGVLESLGGVIFGAFTNMEDSEFLPEIVREYSQFVNGPVICGYPFGHIHPAQALPVGEKVAFAASPEGLDELSIVD